MILLGIAFLTLVLAVGVVLTQRRGTQSSAIPVTISGNSVSSGSTSVARPTSLVIQSTETSAPRVKTPLNSPELISNSIEWSVPSGVISQSDERQIKTAVSNTNLQSRTTEGTHVNITSAHISGNWGVLYGERKANDPGKDATGTVTFLLEKNGSNWRVITEDDSDFCLVLNQLPDSVMSDDDIAFYPDCAKSP
jgi:hypothetical protein